MREHDKPVDGQPTARIVILMIHERDNSTRVTCWERYEVREASDELFELVSYAQMQHFDFVILDVEDH